MKSHPIVKIYILTALATATLILPPARGEEDEAPEMTVAQVEAFLSENLPESLALLEYVRKNETIEDYRGAFERAVETVREFHEIREHEGEKRAEWFLHLIRLELQIEQLALEWQANQNEAQRKRIREDLRAKITELFDHELQGNIEDLALLRKEVVTIEQEIDSLQSNRDFLIGEELKEILEEH